MGGTPVGGQVERGDHGGCAPAAGYELGAQLEGGVEVGGGAVPVGVAGLGGGLCGELGGDAVQGAGAWWALQEAVSGVDPDVGVEEVVVGGLQDADGGAAGVDGRGDGGGSGA